jgi:uncharacterized protein YecT (DUF1311 family)
MIATRNGLVILLLLCGEVAHAASFDCRKARTSQEKAICASPELSAADDQMVAAYKSWLAAVPPEIAQEARGEQRTWLRQLAANCKADEAESTTALAACMLNQYPARIKEVRAKVVTMGSVTFYWRSISLKESDGPDIGPPGTFTEVNPGFGTLEAEWPQATSTTPEWKAWNEAIESATREMTERGSEESSRKRAAKWAAAGFVDQQVTTSIGVVTAELVTAAIQNMVDGHGAHPNTNSIEFNWLLNEKRKLQPKDVFRAGSGWQQFLQKRCDKYLHEQLDTDDRSYESFEQPGEMAKTLYRIIVTPEDWQLDGKGLTIPFQPYAVACYACTPDPFTVPWNELQPYLQTSFVRPR